MDDELYMPPCCIDRKLPPLIKSGGACSFFYSQGDWGLQKLWNAASSLVPNTSFSFLAVETLDVYALRFIRTYFERGWIRAIAIVTADQCHDIIKTELSKYLDRVWYCGRQKMAAYSNLWIRTSHTEALVISGPLSHTEGMKHPCAYTASLTSVNMGHLTEHRSYQAFLPWRSMLRLHANIKGTDKAFQGWLT